MQLVGKSGDTAIRASILLSVAFCLVEAATHFALLILIKMWGYEYSSYDAATSALWDLVGRIFYLQIPMQLVLVAVLNFAFPATSFIGTLMAVALSLTAFSFLSGNPIEVLRAVFFATSYGASVATRILLSSVMALVIIKLAQTWLLKRTLVQASPRL